VLLDAYPKEPEQGKMWLIDKPQNKPHQYPHRKLRRQPHRKKKNSQCWRCLRQHHPLPPHQL
jgi:hypothetical protein